MTSTRLSRGFRTWLIDRGGLIFLCALGLYVALACPHIVENDNAEFATLGAVGGIAHPSGYPLYVLWLRLWSWLPAQSPAHAAAIATALLGALQILVLHAACRAWGARPTAASIAVAVFAAAPLVLRYNTEAEAFALNDLVVAAVLWLAAAGGPLRGGRRAAALGLVAGLGLANHMTCALVAPVGLLGVVRAARESRASRAAALAALGFIVGLAPYLYMFVAPDNLVSWRHPHTLGDILDIALRRQFGGPFAFTGLQVPVAWGAQLAELARSLARSWLWLLAPLALATLGIRSVRTAPETEPRAGWVALGLAFVLAGPVLVTRFDIAVDGYGLYVVHRFHLLPILLLVIPTSLGLDLVADRARVTRWLRVRPGVARAVAAAGMLFLGVIRLPYLARFRSPAFETEVRNTLESLPPDAVIMGYVNELDIGARYLQLAEGVRPDVVSLRWASMLVGWYRARFARYGLAFDPRGTSSPKRRLAEQLLATGRPLFVHFGDTKGLDGLPKYPLGVVLRVLPPGSPLPSLQQLFAMNRAVYAHFDLAYAVPGRHDEFATWMHDNYALTWQRLGDALARAGLAAEAAEARALASKLAPRD